MNTDRLVDYGACEEAVEWVAEQPSAADAWRTCERGDWMLWLLGRLSGGPGSDRRRPLVLCACECARLALEYVPEGEDRPRVAIETAEAWARGEGPSLDAVEAAAEAASAAVWAVDAAVWAVEAASAAVWAVEAAYAAVEAGAVAAYVSAWAAEAVEAAADAAGYDYDSAADARRQVLAQCANIVRKHYPRPPRLESTP